MYSLYNSLETIDKFTDCIPLLATVKNVTIGMFQIAHKVDKAANPVQISQRNDIKIYALSKDDFSVFSGIVPIIGNFIAIIALVEHIINLINRKSSQRTPISCLYTTGPSITKLKKHGYEILAHFLAHNPDCQEEDLKDVLDLAACIGNKEIFSLILDSKVKWSPNLIGKYAYFNSYSMEISEIVLEKHSDIIFNDGDVKSSIIHSFMFSLKADEHGLIELLRLTHPDENIKQNCCGFKNAEEKEKAIKFFRLLKNYCSDLEERCETIALNQLVFSDHASCINLLFKYSPSLITANRIDYLLRAMAQFGHRDVFNWLLDQYGNNINPTLIGEIIDHAARRYPAPYLSDVIEACMSKLPLKDLTGKDLEPILRSLAINDRDLFEEYLNKFLQLKPEDLEYIFHSALNLYTHPGFLCGERVAVAILKKFPTINIPKQYRDMLRVKLGVIR